VFHLVAAQVEELNRALSERSVDLCVAQRVGPLKDEQLEFDILYDDSYVVVAGAQNPWARRPKIELAELVNESWVLAPPETAFGSIAVEAFRASGLSYPRTTVFTFPLEVRISLLATGRFLSILPASVLKFSTKRAELKVLPVELQLPGMPIGIITHKNRTLGPVGKLFVEQAREVAKPLGKKKG
jgi:DNA-binding transcriptional LysR family regulator